MLCTYVFIHSLYRLVRSTDSNARGPKMSPVTIVYVCTHKSKFLCHHHNNRKYDFISTIKTLESTSLTRETNKLYPINICIILFVVRMRHRVSGKSNTRVSGTHPVDRLKRSGPRASPITLYTRMYLYRAFVSVERETRVPRPRRVIHNTFSDGVGTGTARGESAAAPS